MIEAHNRKKWRTARWLSHSTDGTTGTLEVQVGQKLTHDDYQHFVLAFERLVKQHGKIRVLFQMSDFHGWDAGAVWADIEFDLKHFGDIERLAMVGDRKWEKGMKVRPSRRRAHGWTKVLRSEDVRRFARRRVMIRS